MSLNRKKSRKITVDGVLYRWCVAKHPHEFQNPEPPESMIIYYSNNIIIELLNSPQSQIISTYSYKAKVREVWDVNPVTGITPKAVAEIIIEALDNGWNPQMKENYKLEQVEDLKKFARTTSHKIE